MKENRTFSEDIERAERALLAFSWLGVISALIIMAILFGAYHEGRRFGNTLNILFAEGGHVEVA